MPYTVEASFDKFRENIEVSGYSREIATNRKDHLVKLLSAQFDILEAFPSGSLPRYTAVKEHTDLDIVVALHYSKHIKDKKPSEVLSAVRNCLGEDYTNVRRNGQAVTLYYKTWPNVDVVPVSRSIDGSGNVTHYNVPDMNREVWLVSKPQVHDTDMEEKNKQCGPRFKRIVKMIKWWNHQHSHLLQSFHIEALALRVFSGDLSEYSWNVHYFFDQAYKLTGSPLYHSGDQVDGYLDSDGRKEVLKRLETANNGSRDAWYYTYNGRNDHEAAIKIWRQIFGDEFPAYG